MYVRPLENLADALELVFADDELREHVRVRRVRICPPAPGAYTSIEQGSSNRVVL